MSLVMELGGASANNMEAVVPVGRWEQQTRVWGKTRMANACAVVKPELEVVPGGLGRCRIELAEGRGQ